jgi:hypothetical protein
LQTGQDPLSDPFPLELGQGSQDMELELSRRRGAINPLPETDKLDSQRLKFLKQTNEVLEIATKAIQTPADQHVESSAFGICEELVEGRTSILRTAYSTVYIFPPFGPSPSLDITSEFLKLVLGLLVERRDSGIDGGPHRRASVSAVPALRIWSATFRIR